MGGFSQILIFFHCLGGASGDSRIGPRQATSRLKHSDGQGCQAGGDPEELTLTLTYEVGLL